MEVTEGLYSGGWGAARPKVSDSTYAEGRFKFFLGATAWGAGELEAEFKSGAWVRRCSSVKPTYWQLLKRSRGSKHFANSWYDFARVLLLQNHPHKKNRTA